MTEPIEIIEGRDTMRIMRGNRASVIDCIAGAWCIVIAEQAPSGMVRVVKRFGGIIGEDA